MKKSMYVRVTPQQVALIASFPELADLTESVERSVVLSEARADAVEAARNQYETDDLEIDDAPLVTVGDHSGYWVQAWVWVAKDSIKK